MNRATRDRFVSGTKSATAKNAKWETPPGVYEKLAADFGPFDLDLTADGTRNLTPRWFGPDSTIARNALTCDWLTYGASGYSNPPYGAFVPRILAVAVDAAARGFSSTFLLPLRVTGAFRELILCGASDLLFCDKRICFYENGQPRWNAKALRERGRFVPDPAIFDSIVVRYRPGKHASPLVGVWTVPPHVRIPSRLTAAQPSTAKELAI